MTANCQNPEATKQSQIIAFPPQCFTVVIMFAANMSAVTVTT